MLKVSLVWQGLLHARPVSCPRRRRHSSARASRREWAGANGSPRWLAQRWPRSGRRACGRRGLRPSAGDRGAGAAVRALPGGRGRRPAPVRGRHGRPPPGALVDGSLELCDEARAGRASGATRERSSRGSGVAHGGGGRPTGALDAVQAMWSSAGSNSRRMCSGASGGSSRDRCRRALESDELDAEAVVAAIEAGVARRHGARASHRAPQPARAPCRGGARRRRGAPRAAPGSRSSLMTGMPTSPQQRARPPRGSGRIHLRSPSACSAASGSGGEAGTWRTPPGTAGSRSGWSTTCW